MPSSRDDDLSRLALEALSDHVTMDQLMRRVRDVSHRYCAARLASYAGGSQLADLAASREQRAVRVAEVAEMTRILELLPPRLREVLILRVAMGLTAERVGDTLDMSAGAVRIAQHRGLRRLRSLLDERSRTLAVAAR